MAPFSVTALLSWSARYLQRSRHRGQVRRVACLGRDADWWPLPDSVTERMHPAVGWIHTLADSLERRFGSGQRDVWAPSGFWGRGRLRAWCMGRQQHPQDRQALLDPLPPASFYDFD